MTDNLVAELRSWKGLTFGPYRTPVPEMLRAADEIERLTASLASARELIAHAIGGEPQFERLTAAKAEQVALKDTFRKQLEVVEAERDRLRAALERIAADSSLSNREVKSTFDAGLLGGHAICQHIAREALAGGGEYSPEAVKRILAARDGPSHEVCCDKFPDCECPERAGGGEK